MSGRAAGLALVAFFAAAPAVETVRAQGLGDAAARQRQEREKKAREAKPAPTYTNEALEGSGEPGGQETKATEDAGRESSGVSADPAPETESAGAEAHWRRQADEDRRAIANAERALAEAEARGAQLLQDRDPLSGLLDPNRLQTLEAQRAKARAEAEAARQALAEARQALADLEEEARRKNVPPGWLRER
jgi:colicin import membrane protein